MLDLDTMTTLTPPTCSTDKEHRAFLKRLRADLFSASRCLDKRQARYLVDLYYQLQEFRKAAKNQARAADSDAEPNEIISWLGAEFRALEDTIKRAMGEYASQSEVGRWSQAQFGIGPVLSGGLVAHIDITKAPTTGSVWRFAGLDPSVTWKKGCKRPWNAKLKVLAWKISDCLVKFSNNPKCFYGQLYRQYKAKLIERNEAGEFAEAAAEGAQRVGKTTEAYGYYVRGLLPPGHLDARAKRWTAKLFLSHWHEVAYEAHYGEPSPKPYVLAHLDHAHKIEVPRPDRA